MVNCFKLVVEEMRSTLNLINSGLFNINYIIPHEPLIAFLCVLDFKASFITLHRLASSS